MMLYPVFQRIRHAELSQLNCSRLCIYLFHRRSVGRSVNCRPSTRSIVVPIVQVRLAALQSWAPITWCLRHNTRLCLTTPLCNRLPDRSWNWELLKVEAGAWHLFCAGSISLLLSIHFEQTSALSSLVSGLENRDATFVAVTPHALLGFGTPLEFFLSSCHPGQAMPQKRPPARHFAIQIGARGLSHQSRVGCTVY